MSTQIYPNISDDEIKICEKLLSEGKLPHKFALRVQTVLARAKKIPTQEIAKVLGLRATTINIPRRSASGHSAQRFALCVL